MDKDCKDFRYQEDAQEYFNSHGGSKTNNFDRLDADHDGVACEKLPHRPVTATTAPSQDSTLASTGPMHTSQEFIGGSLILILGVVLLFLGKRKKSGI